MSNGHGTPPCRAKLLIAHAVKAHHVRKGIVRVLQSRRIQGLLDFDYDQDLPDWINETVGVRNESTFAVEQHAIDLIAQFARSVRDLAVNDAQVEPVEGRTLEQVTRKPLVHVA